MKAIVYELTAPRTLLANEHELQPETLGPSELLAATEFSAISPGTELAAWVGRPPLRPSQAYPRLIGYCNVAKVLKVGEGITDIDPGDHILTHQSHRSHFRCRRSEVLVAERGLDTESCRKLATTFLYHLGYVSLIKGGYVPGYEVAVVGLGALGLTTASLLLAFGSEPIIFSSLSREQAPPCLAGTRVLPKVMPASEQWQSSSMGGADLVIDTSDGWSDYLLSLKLARKGGTVILLGFPGRGEPLPEFNPLDSQYLYDKQLTVRQVGPVSDPDVPASDIRFTLKRNLGYLFSLIRRGSVDPSPLLAWQVSWHDLGGVYEKLTARRSSAYSALIDWTS